jgi:hypothetical protein
MPTNLSVQPSVKVIIDPYTNDRHVLRILTNWLRQPCQAYLESLVSAGKSSEVGLLVGSLSSCSAVGHGVAMSIPTPTDGT